MIRQFTFHSFQMEVYTPSTRSSSRPKSSQRCEIIYYIGSLFNDFWYKINSREMILGDIVD